MITIKATGDTTLHTAGKYCEEDILIKVPEAGGVELPELTNEGTAIDLLSGKQLINSDGNIVTGTMSNNGAISSTMDGINVKSVTVPAGYTSGGTVSLDNTIDNEVNAQVDLLAQAVAALEGKAAGGSIETCTGQLNLVGSSFVKKLLYSNGNSIINYDFSSNTLTVAKNSILYMNTISQVSGSLDIRGNIEIIYASNWDYVLGVKGDFSIDLTNEPE